MTGSTPGIESQNGLALSDVQSVQFPETKGFGRGYDESEVDAFIDRCAGEIQRLTKRIEELEAQAQDVAPQPPDNEQIVLHSVSILTTAQQTADGIVRNADDYSARVMAEARAVYEDARRKSATMLEDAQLQATEAMNEATERHDEIARQTVYLQTLRDSTQVQVQTFLTGLLDHVSNEYGRALPAAAEAARQRSPGTASARRVGRDESQVEPPPGDQPSDHEPPATTQPG
jgi:DivIVA domain-containing protein